MYPRDPNEAIKELQKLYSLPENFYDNLYHEDDWSFIIKTNALMEAALGDLVTVALGDNRLHDFISKSTTYNKNAIAKALDLVDGSCRDLIQKLAQLRNLYVHNVESVTLDLRGYISRPGKAEYFAKGFSLGIDDINFDDRKLSNIEYFRDDPKYYIGVMTMLCLGIIYVKKVQIMEKLELEVVRVHELGQLKGIEMVLQKLGLFSGEEE